MRHQALAFVTGVVVLGTAAVLPAAADITLKSRNTYDSPQMRAQLASVPREYRDAFIRYTDMTVTNAVSGKKMRTDMPTVSLITDCGARTKTQLYDNKTYTVSIFDPAVANRLLPTSTNAILDTGKSSILLGHTVHEYIVTASVKNADGTSTTAREILWAAQDLDPADTASFSPFVPKGSGKARIRGIPLLVTETITGGKQNGTKVTMVVTSISKAPIPKSAFEIPPGYVRAGSSIGAGSLGKGLP